jgi:2'-5' RNA ligase
VRCFLGIPLPADCRNAIKNSWVIPEPERPSLKLTDPGQWHITLGFFGDVAYDQLIRLVQFIGQALETPPEGAFRIRSIQTFPSKKPTMYAAIVQPEQEAMWQQCVGHLVEMASLCAPQTDRKPWLPHATLARTRNARILDPMEIQLENVGWVPEFATLYRSEPTVNGHKFIPLHEYRLNL